MSKKNLKILLDTSFLLPFLGFKTDDIVMNTLPILREYEIYYNDISILEALWKIAKTVGKEEVFTVVSRGVDSLKRTFKHADIDERAVAIALKMYVLGHRDMIDNILYGISVSREINLLTIDESLKMFIEGRGLRNTLIQPRELT
ncbi:MAG: PIN domain nuclease [Thermoprotei archaeon]|nr:PIN domain nuclease [Thermoprotei archaeon]